MARTSRCLRCTKRGTSSGKGRDLYALLEADFPKWWMPDDILFVNEIPKTSVGKFLKHALRDQLKTYMVEQK